MSISNLKLPSPSVVVGDTDARQPWEPERGEHHGVRLRTARRFPVNQSLLRARYHVTIDATGTIRGVTGDGVGGRIVASAGGLADTGPVRVVVTVAPTTVAKSDCRSTDPAVNTETDTSKSTNWVGPSRDDRHRCRWRICGRVHRTLFPAWKRADA